MAADVRVLTRVPITFETADGGRTHAPLVVGGVGGVTMRFVLDTGSDVHILNKELVDRLGLAFEEGEEGTDHSGATMPSWTVEDAVLELGEVELTLRDLVSIPAPAPFPSRGIGGILSPQHLHPDALTVIDLVADELLLLDGADGDVASWLAATHPSLTTLVLERDGAFASVVVEAAVSPHPAIPMLINTGGRHTEFSREAAPGLADAPSERLGGGVSGGDVVGARVGEATVLVSGHEVPVPSLALRDSMHDPQGMVGMDVLPGTVLAVGADLARPVVWQVP